MTVSLNKSGACNGKTTPFLNRIRFVVCTALVAIWTGVALGQTPFEEDASILPNGIFEKTITPAPLGGISTLSQPDTVDQDRDNTANVASDPDYSNAQEPMVRTGELAAMDSAAIGVLNIADGGFAPSLWEGISRARVEKLLPGLPVATPSPVINSLVRRLLLSRAEVPDGPSSVPSFLALRVERLMAAGWPADVVRLVGRSATSSDNPAVARARSNALFLSGDLPAVCATAEIMIRDSDDPYWLQAVTLCRAKAGDTAGAALAVELVHELGEADPDFIALSAALLGGSKKAPPELSNLNALQFEMLRAMGVEIPPELEATATPAILHAMAHDQAIDLDRRLAIANQAAMIGAVSGEDLGRIYSNVAFAPDDIPQALNRAKTNPGPRSRALLFQLASGDQEAEDTRLQALQTLWRSADKEGVLRAEAAATLGICQRLIPRKEFSWLAADAVRALLAAGDLDQAMRWYATLSDETKVRMWPLLAVANATGIVLPPTQALNPWLKTLADLTDIQKQDRTARVFSLLEALGLSVTDELWQAAVSDRADKIETPDLAVLALLDRARGAARVGEVVIFVLKALAPAGPANTHPLVLARVIRSLTEVGLEDDARRIAVEALLGAGF